MQSPTDVFREARKRRMAIIQEKRQRRKHIQTNSGKDTTKTPEKKDKYLTLGSPVYECQYCKAIMWFEERVKKATKKNHVGFSLCCSEGRIVLPKLNNAPPFLRNLLQNKGGKSTIFQNKIRTYNSCFAFTSMGAKLDSEINKRPGPYVYRISGQNYHHIGSLIPPDKYQPSFAQLYIYDTDADGEIKLRDKVLSRGEEKPELDRDILKGIKNMLDEVNPFVKTYRMAQNRIREDKNVKLSIRLFGASSHVTKTYNKPTASEVAALVVGDIGASMGIRDIVVENKKVGLQRIREDHQSYMPLQYPILFPYGEYGYHKGIPYANGGTNKRKFMTMQDHQKYRLQQRKDDGETLLRGGRLLQQYIVDNYCAIEQERPDYIRYNQAQFRCDILNNIQDAICKGDLHGAATGKRIILNSKFTGGPRYLQQHYQDAMAICRWYGNPHLFITFTANKKWPEIEAMLSHIDGQKADDRPDIITRVFRLKLKQLKECLKKENFFGNIIADVHTIEFQKRGLPHAHILIWLKQEDIHTTAAYIDSIISAEIPDKAIQPELYEAVSQFMVHGPCGPANTQSPCMVDKKCSKKFPKAFNSETTFDHNGYPVYRRREDGRVIIKGQQSLDNRSVVPYNPELLLMFKAHINVEWCNTARAIKYLFKYITKGPDRATVTINSDINDEIKTYQNCRYISACEASWRIFEFEIQERTPSVIRLPVHLEGEQAVVVKDSDKLQKVVNSSSVERTMLTEWMRTNATDTQARKLTYAEFPTKYVWGEPGKDTADPTVNSDDNTEDTEENLVKVKIWKRRRAGDSIGRITFVHPTAGERYYLRILLNKVKGATSFENIRTVNGVTFSSFKQACYAMGLLHDDNEWNDAIKEAQQWAFEPQLRELFVTILLFCEVTDVKRFWEQNFEILSKDIEDLKRQEYKHPTLELTDEQKRTYTLHKIDKILMKFGKSLAEIKNMPEPNFKAIEGMDNRLIREEKNYDTKMLHEESVKRRHNLNPEQLEIYEKVLEAVENKNGELFFVHGHGGTGKTFLYTTISGAVRAQKKIVLTVASSGIAAILLPGGRTTHSRFEIPIDLLENSTCNVPRKSNLEDLLFGHH